MRLSVLDQSIAVAGRPHEESIRNTVALARHSGALTDGTSPSWYFVPESKPEASGQNAMTPTPSRVV